MLIAVILIPAILVSCTKVIDISIPEQERKIVVNGLISPGEPVLINLSRSLSVLEDDKLNALAGADARLFRDDVLIGTMQYESGGNYSLPGFSAEIGQTYRLQVDYEGLKSVEAVATIPPPVPIISVDTATLTGDWGGTEMRLSVKFRDPAGVHNIYGFGVDVRYKEFDYRTNSYTGNYIVFPAYIEENSGQFVQDEFVHFGGKLYVEDLIFDGLTQTVEFGFIENLFYESDTVWINVKMEQPDPSFYLYAKSNEAYQGAHDNPFSEPVQVYTNIKGGYGIFSGYSSAGYSVMVLFKGKSQNR